MEVNNNSIGIPFGTKMNFNFYNMGGGQISMPTFITEGGAFKNNLEEVHELIDWLCENDEDKKKKMRDSIFITISQ